MTYDLASFGRFTRNLKLEDGSPLLLEKFQREILRDHFGAGREVVVIIPKKNYKTTTLAALALFHLHETNQGDVPILASSSKQAGIMFRQAEKLVRNSGSPVEGTGYRQTTLKDVYNVQGVKFEIRSGLREIRARGGLLYVVAADTDRLDGVIPTLGLVDELHRHKTGENYGILSDGLGPRKGRMVTISTAGATEDSPLGELRKRAHGYAAKKVARHARYADAAFVLHEWSLDEGDDPDDLRHVKRANPAKTQDLAELARRKALPTMTSGRWLRFACGIWTEGEESAVDPKAWDAARVDIGHVGEGEPVWMAVHPGESAWIAFAARRGERVAVRAEAIGSDPSGVRIERRLLELRDRYDIQQVAHPRMTFLRSAEIMSAAGLPMVETPYSPQRFGVISQTFNRLLSAGELMHDGDPALRTQVLAASSRDSEVGWRYILSPHCAALFAVANACHQVTALPPEAPEFVAL